VALTTKIKQLKLKQNFSQPPTKMFYYIFVSASAHVKQAVYFLHSTSLSITWLNSRWWLVACYWV